MDWIQTVTGRAKPEELGMTLVHEHLLIGFPGWYMDALAPKFERESRNTVVVRYGLAATLKQQIEAGEPFDVAVYMAQHGAPNSGRFLHLPWGRADPVPVVAPNDYAGFPFIADDGRLTRTVIVRINGSI